MLEKMLWQVTQESGERTAIVYDQQRISYQEFYEQVKGFSRGLQQLGITSGDCVACILPNCPEFVIAFYAIARLQGILLPLNHLFKGEEIQYYLNDSAAKVIITDQKRADLCQDIIAKLDRPIDLIITDGENTSGKEFHNLILPEGGEPEESVSSFEGEMLYQYSSGSTGRPKRVSRTQANLYHEAVNFATTAHINSEDRILCIVPLYHAHGLGNCLLAALGNGATLVILEQKRQKGLPIELPFVFRRPRVLELLQQEKITILPAVPYIFNTLGDTPKETTVDFSTVRLTFSAGNFLSKDIFDKFFQRFGVYARQLYGCTEAGSVAINLDPDPSQTYDCVGCPMDNITISIVDDHQSELPPDTIGEVLIESQALTQEYYNMPELNQQAFKDGKFFTGDLGKLDSTGRLYITGRKKILIDTGGRKVDPIEIEDILMSHPQVREVVVVGVKKSYAELVKAVIVPEGDCDEKELVTYCQARMAEFKVPKIIEFREEIPKSPLGKILRKALV